MSPEYSDGDYVITLKPYLRPYQIDDVVLTNYPGLGLIIKRVTRTDKHEVFLAGDNAKSSFIGWVNVSALLGRVIYHGRKP